MFVRKPFLIKETKRKAESFYGDSKLQANLAIQELSDDTSTVCVVRLSTIYGKGSKLRKLCFS